MFESYDDLMKVAVLYGKINPHLGYSSIIEQFISRSVGLGLTPILMTSTGLLPSDVCEGYLDKIYPGVTTLHVTDFRDGIHKLKLSGYQPALVLSENSSVSLNNHMSAVAEVYDVEMLSTTLFEVYQKYDKGLISSLSLIENVMQGRLSEVSAITGLSLSDAEALIQHIMSNINGC